MSKLTIAVLACVISVTLAVNPYQRGAWCGSGWSASIVPDSAPVPPFITCKVKPNYGPSCEKHDKCYDTCGTTQEGCDKAFKDNMEKWCADSGNTDTCLSYCNGGAQLYYQAVKNLGAGAFKTAQAKLKCKN